MGKVLKRRMLPMGDVYIFVKHGRYFYGRIWRRRTNTTKIECFRCTMLQHVESDYMAKVCAQQDTLDGHNPYVGPRPTLSSSSASPEMPRS